MKLASIIRNDTGNDHAPTVVLLHGVFGRARNLGVLQRALSPFFNTVALDLRSHGKSGHGLLTYPDMARDVLDTLDHLNIASACFVGHSMGGKVAMTLSLLAPNRVEQLLVADIAPAPMHHGQNALVQKLISLTLPTLENRAAIRAFLTPTTENPAVTELIGQNIEPGAPARWLIGIEEIAQSFPVIEDWPNSLPHPRWNGPTLFVRGGNSPYIQPQHHGLIHHLFPRAHIRTIPNTHHWLHAEAPERFNEIMLGFLQHTN